MLKLWPHQVAAIGAAKHAIDSGREAGLWSMPTGTGKTMTFASLARELEWSTLVCVHRDELVQQTVNTFAKVWPEASTGVVKAERDEWDGRQVVVASVQSLHARRLEHIPADRFRLVVADEAHHAVAPTWAAVLDHFEADFILGATATPERADGRGLAERFGERPLYSYPLRSAIEDGHLVRLTQYGISTDADLDAVDYRAGDFAEGALADAVNTPARNKVIVEAYRRHADGRRAVAFCVNVQHARDLADAFNGDGVSAAVVTGNTPMDERRQLLVDFAAGRYRIMCNCAVLTEGFDDPGIDCILMARPTTSRPLYVQCVGRGLRLAPDKTDCMVVDFTDNCRRHKLITALDLMGTPKTTNADGRDVIEVADEERHQAEQLHLIASSRPLRWRLERVCPWPELPTLDGYVAYAAWHGAPASDKQLNYLRGMGLDIDRTITKGEASYLIDRAAEYRAAFPEPPTSKQTWFLKSHGLYRRGMTFAEARDLIGRVKAGERIAV